VVEGEEVEVEAGGVELGPDVQVEEVEDRPHGGDGVREVRGGAGEILAPAEGGTGLEGPAGAHLHLCREVTGT
jgi:hypothetical protein